MNKIFKKSVSETLAKVWKQMYGEDMAEHYKAFFDNIKREFDEPEEEIEYTCCNIEVSGILEDIRICPECKEHF